MWLVCVCPFTNIPCLDEHINLKFNLNIYNTYIYIVELKSQIVGESLKKLHLLAKTIITYI